MKPSLAAAFADCLEKLAQALREEAQEQPKAQRQKLSIVAKDKGIPASTLRELVRLRAIPAARVGKGRGTYLIDPDAVERYLETRTSKVRSHLREAVAQ